jgi:SAM-dependent methyltransferase
MSSASIRPEEALALWDAKAAEWEIQVGEEGDSNRRTQSDPVLWRLLGDVRGKRLLDAGCGTGYLSVKLARAGAEHVVAVDWSAKMIERTRAAVERAQLSTVVKPRVDSISELKTVDDASVDALVSNYVLMDAPDLDGACRSLFRVLRPNGRAVLVFSHPCFEPPVAVDRPSPSEIVFRWNRSYFEEGVYQEAPWKHFTTPFVWFHRPLSRYWQAFTEAGFRVERFEEPTMPLPPPEGIELERAHRSRLFPNSVAFLLGKPA